MNNQEKKVQDKINAKKIKGAPARGKKRLVIVMLKFLKLYFFSFFVILAFNLQAQVSFDAKVSKKRLGLNERLRIDFEMNENGDNFNPPLFKNFQIISGPQQAVSRSWVNGVQKLFKNIYIFSYT